MYSFKKTKVISCNDGAGPQSPTNACSITQHIFSSDHLEGTMQLVLLPVLMSERTIKRHSQFEVEFAFN